MKYKIGKWGWPISAAVVPGGWIVDTDVPPDQMDHWSREIWQRKLQPPPDAVAMDQATQKAMEDMYGTIWRGAAR
jgi:hypothetical protein